MVDNKKAQAASQKAKAKSKKAGAQSKKAKAVTLSKALIVKDIMLESKILRISTGSAKAFAEKTAEKVAKWAEKKGGVTENDINKYNIEKRTIWINEPLGITYNIPITLVNIIEIVAIIAPCINEFFFINTSYLYMIKAEKQ